MSNRDNFIKELHILMDKHNMTVDSTNEYDGSERVVGATYYFTTIKQSVLQTNESFSVGLDEL